MAILADIISEIEIQFSGVITAPTYPVEISTVSNHNASLDALSHMDYPHISLIDTGAERRVVDLESTFSRFESELIIRGAVKSTTAKDLLDDVGVIEATIKQLIHAAPSLTQVLQWKFLEVIDRIYHTTPERNLGVVDIRTRVLYWISTNTY